MQPVIKLTMFNTGLGYLADLGEARLYNMKELNLHFQDWQSRLKRLLRIHDWKGGSHMNEDFGVVNRLSVLGAVLQTALRLIESLIN